MTSVDVHVHKIDETVAATWAELISCSRGSCTLDLLLRKGNNRLVDRYALPGFAKPIGVADWEAELVSSLPVGLQACLPTVEEIEAELERLEASQAS